MDLLAPLGPVYQAGTLSGNPLAMAAGIATVGYLQEHAQQVYPQLEATAKAVAEGVAAEAAKAGVPLTLNRVGAMWTWFFTAGPVTDYDEAAQSRYGGVSGGSIAPCWSRACGCRRRSSRRRFLARRTARQKCAQTIEAAGWRLRRFKTEMRADLRLVAPQVPRRRG